MSSRRSQRLAVALLAFSSSLAHAGTLDAPRGAFLEDVLSGGASQTACKPSGMIQDACCHFEDVEAVNERLSHALNEIVKEPFFRYHRVDLYRDCPFWTDEGACGNRACAVDELDEDDIPPKWRSHALGGLQTPEPGAVPTLLEGGCEVQETDFCVLEDQTTTESVFVDLMENPERFTGYTGDSAHKVWKAIYEENCFGVVPYLPPSRSKDEGGGGFITGLESTNLRSLMGSLAGPRDAGEEMCLEKRVFYRIMSGLHASISIHICDEYLDQRTGQWSPNLQCFISRIAQHPERLQNVYFDYVLLLRAFEKSSKYFQGYDIATGDDEVDKRTRRAIVDLTRQTQACPSTFDESTMFSGQNADMLKDEFKHHFRNISRIMDCVGCDRCRLWGKLQVTGLGTALKLLFSYEDDPSASTGMTLQRSEIVAFVNTLHRFSESLAAIDRFRKLWADRDKRTSTALPTESTPAVESASMETKVEAAPVVPEPPRASQSRSTSSTLSRPKRGAFEDFYGPESQTLPPQPKARSIFASNATQGGDFFDALMVACRASWQGCASLTSRMMQRLWAPSALAKVEL